MNIKRIGTAIVGLPIVILVIVFGNNYIIDGITSIIAMIAIYEYAKCISKEAKFISWVGYIVAIGLAFLHVIPDSMMSILKTFGIPILLFILFLNVIVTNMKITFKDMSYTFVGILYIICFLGFLPLLYGVSGSVSGKILIWYVFLTAWGTDCIAYIVGRGIGKHKFSKVSPNKTIEGCIGGALGAIIFSLIYTYFLNMYLEVNISYETISVLSAILSVIGQVGDFSASVIKRHFGIKDFSELFPGHGGMIDRIDSVMFIAPFAYFLLTMFL